MNSSIENIGENIRILRIKNNLSQEQLALNAGVNTSYIGQIERGEKNPTIKTLEKISFTLNIELIDLLHPSYPQKEGIQSLCNYTDSNLTPEKIKQYY
ncbi:transcriptional regulator with XRE-family HTH domain [Paenibacillus turicensis]|uniref:Transcriptional regulator with XRE-family HTH domain n=1 Tax=Paenibacillus turicensis TaxID=160487 RepID=A0ABS4FQ22_9BACL|nr:helix-turn-helix transcriptional regulator [Paenibacillus turicensis]MBP1904438.1 transcriptional regulator with XRE-family HTH domain [Paenibacillus turicensis]